jgi:phosphopantothenoylcysteine decarboxylase/phosphopantothenate--cysteine ligase
VLLVAPATANTVGKIAAAVDDTPVTTCATTALGAGVPVVIAPAMHEPMYDHPGVVESLGKLERWGVSFVDPRLEEGKAKIAAEADIVTGVARAATPDTLDGRTVVVTAGGTSEPIDPVRVLGNRASGRTGRAVARACHVAGADVVLVHDGPDVGYAETEQVQTAAEMIAAVEAHAGDADALVSAAAIGDYTVEAADEKIRSGQNLTLELRPTPKLIDTVRTEHPDLTIVGFKAETTGDDEAMVGRAREVRDRVGLAFVVANDASVMGADDTRVLFVDSHSVEEFVGAKTDLGIRVAERLADEF